MLATMSTDACGFALNIMDPRMGTRFPESPKQALDELLEAWQQPK